MAEASAHHKQMENFMRAEILMLCIEKRKLQGIDNAADGVDDAAGKKPAKGCMGKLIFQ